MKILFKNAAFLTSRIFASAMIRVFPSLEHSTGHVRTPKTICRTFVPPLPVPNNGWHKSAILMSQ
jgi:hypothetical protein